MVDGRATHQPSYDLTRHVTVYLGINGMPVRRKDDDPTNIYHPDKAV